MQHFLPVFVLLIAISPRYKVVSYCGFDLHFHDGSWLWASSHVPGGHLPLLIEVKVAQLCLILCHSMDYTVHGILQARILEWVAFPFSRDPLNPGVKPRCPALQAGYLSADPPGKPNKTGVGTFPFSRALPNSRIELGSLALWADSLPTELSGKPICSLENVYSVLLPILKNCVVWGFFDIEFYPLFIYGGY